MNRRLVCDTNVWYDFGNGRRDPNALKSIGDKLLVSPMSFIEIASRLNRRTLQERRKAAQAVIDHADDVLLDSDRHLARAWSIPVEQLTVDWMEGFRAIEGASSVDDLDIGVEDFRAGVVRRVNVALAAQLREVHYKDFQNEIVNLTDSEFPGYKAARNMGTAKYMDKVSRTAYKAKLDMPEFEESVLMGTWCRAALNSKVLPPFPTSPEVQGARSRLSPYLRAYRSYLFLVATKFAPEENDWGDLECFVYLDDGCQLVTADKRWIDVAQEAGLAQRIVT